MVIESMGYIKGNFRDPQGHGTPENGKRDPYHSHIFRDSYGSGMGIVWEADHEGVPSFGVPENPTDYKLYTYKLGILGL